uniref:Trimethyllysine dioxygenase, mitochondrial n=1 Tax=Ascaris suum TaxID=6253 RepID=F1L4V1_ASCSU
MRARHSHHTDATWNDATCLKITFSPSQYGLWTFLQHALLSAVRDMQRALALHIRRFPKIVRSMSTMDRLRVIGIELDRGMSDSPYVRIDYTKGACDETRRMHVPLVWFRDHSRDPSSYNFATNQRKSALTSIFERSQLAHIKDALQYDSESRLLRIHWKDGIRSEFMADDLLAWSIREENCEPSKVIELWDQSNLARLPNISISNFTLEAFAKSFVRYGLVSVSGVDASEPQRTKELCERVAPIHNTFYGDFWVFGNQQQKDENSHEDTAYGNEAIGVHTDGTYFEQTPGIQVFHCLRPAKKGGDTILVDGFAVAEKLRRQNEGYYKLLTNTPIEHHYIEGGESPSTAKIYARSVDKPVISLDRQGNLRQIRFNPYDRAPFAIQGRHTLAAEDVVDFYKAYEWFSKLAHDPSSELRVSLKPGTVVFLDNFRILHARTAFQGDRQMCGCYLSRDNLLALIRHLLPQKHRSFV